MTNKSKIIFIIVSAILGSTAVISVPISMKKFGFKGLVIPLIFCILILVLGKFYKNKENKKR